MRRSIALLLVSAACSSNAAPRKDASPAEASAPVDASPKVDGTVLSDGAPTDALANVDKAATCAASFGDALTNAFGRIDGTVLAVVPPADDACADINGTHVVIQVTLAGVAYRMVLDVLSSYGDPNVYFYEEDAPLVAEAWSEGWHPGITLDYVNTLRLHSTQFTSMVEAALIDKVASEITIGSHISVFATSDDEPNSAHLIHRNVTGQDGAIVINPESAPHYLLFRFSDQDF